MPHAAGVQQTMTMSSALGNSAGACSEDSVTCGEVQFGRRQFFLDEGNEVYAATLDDSFLNCKEPLSRVPINNCVARGEPLLPDFDAAHDDVFSFLSILDACLQVNMHTHVGLRDFVLHSLESEPRNVHSQRKPRDLWPCPPPLWKWTGCKKPSPRRRRQIKFWALRNRVVQQIICVLNWEALGHVKSPPPAARVGSPISLEQLDMIGRIEDLVTYFMQVGDFSTSSLGRSADKLSRLLHACKELPESAQDVDLEFLSSFVKECVDPYSRRSQTSDVSSGRESHDENPVNSTSQVSINLETTTAKPVISDRIKWEHSPSFDPRPFLVDPVVREAFSDPNCMRLPESLWIRRPVVRAQVG